MKLKNYILFIISIYQLFFCNVYSQTTIPDSLFNEINKAEKICPQPCPNDSNIAILFLKIGDFFENENPDTAKYFYKQALKVSKSIKNPKYEAKSLLYIGYIFENKGDYLQPLNYYYTAIKILIPLNDIKDIAASYISIGNCFYSQGNFQKAIENMLKALHYYEEMYKKASSPIDLYDSRRGVCASLSNIGCVHTDMGNYKSALEYHNKALKIYFEISKSNSEKEKTFGKGGISRCYNNIGNVYDYQGKFQLALEYYKKSIKIKKELNDIRGICLLYNNIGNIYGQIGEYAQAIETYRNSLTKYKELDDKTGLSLVNGNISALYIMLADSMAFSQSAKLNYLNKAITYGLESYNIANKINAVPQLNEAASQLNPHCSYPSVTF